jgi:hypothetical protein
MAMAFVPGKESSLLQVQMEKYSAGILTEGIKFQDHLFGYRGD